MLGVAVFLFGLAVSLLGRGIGLRVGARRSLAPLTEPGALPSLARLVSGPSRVVGRTRWGRRVAAHPLLASRLDRSRTGWSVEALSGTKIGMGVGAGILTSAASVLVPPAALLTPLVGLLAYRIPDIVLARLAAHRRSAVAERVPELVEVLVAATEAGLGPAISFRRAAEVVGGALGEELRRAVRHMDLGVSWRQALSDLAEGSEASGLRRLVTTLARSQRLGASVVPSLRRLAEELRRERRAAAEEAARRAPVKMLFPLVFLVLPAFLLLTVGPVLLATVRSLS